MEVVENRQLDNISATCVSDWECFVVHWAGFIRADSADTDYEDGWYLLFADE